MKKISKNKFLIFILLLIFISTCIALVGCKNKDSDSTDSDSNNNDNNPAPVEKQIMLDELKYDYQSVGHGSLSINKDNNGNKLSLYTDGQEQEYEHGFYAHAYSVIVFENLQTKGFTEFSANIGINKTARTANSQTSVVFRIYLDNELAYESKVFDAYTDSEFVELNISGRDRITLLADSLEHNAHDHAVWANASFSYYDAIKPDLKVYDVEFPSTYSVTQANILALAKATSADGRDLTDKISYSTDYTSGATGEFSVTYSVSDGGIKTQKTIKMNVLSSDRFVKNASSEYLKSPFADFVYYGRSLLSKESRKAYDLIMEKLLEVNISDSSQNTLTINLQENNIYIFPTEVTKIKKYLIYDEARLYYIYYWAEGETAGVSYTKKNGFVDTVTIKLYNGTNGYYKGQDNHSVYSKAEDKISQFFANLTYDMTDAQLLYKDQNAYRPTIGYSNEAFADGFYGAFILGRCICSGYSKGYSYLAQRLGIRVAYIVGTAGGAHAWNYLYADGDWYMTDTTWGDGNSFGLLGQSYMNEAGRYDHGNYDSMPTLSQERYDLDIMQYPLMSIKSGFMLKKGAKLNAEDLVTIKGAVAEKAPLTSVSYTGNFNSSVAGIYKIMVTAKNSLGNVVQSQCSVQVYNNTQDLNTIQPTMTGSSNYNFKEVSLCYGGQEQQFKSGLYTKANGTLSLTFDISQKAYTNFSTYIGIDKSIRDNVPWGQYANATVKVYFDDKVVYQKSGIKWKDDMTYLAVSIPEGTKTMKLEITDNSGQGAVSFGDCKLYY